MLQTGQICNILGEVMQKENILGTQPVGKLLRKFAVPSIVSMLVISLYNIVDQFFIGRTVGHLGNAATNVSFPITTLCLAVTLAFGIGGASGFNLNMGAGEKKKAMYFVGNSITMLFIIGVVIAIVGEVFLSPLLVLFGSPKSVLPYGIEYMRVILIGAPFVMMANGGAHLIRGDGSPWYSMVVNLSGAIANVILDYLFVMKFGWGMTGAAVATVIGQVLSFSFVVRYLFNFKAGKLLLEHTKPKFAIVKRTIQLGAAQFFNQLAMMLVQVVANISASHYGALSKYGSAIPLACAGIAIKIIMIYFSFCIGISQGMQPIASYNKGAGKHDRVKKVFLLALACNEVISIVAFIVLQVFPREIMGLFGNGSAEYFEYAVKFCHIFTFMTFLNGIQPLSSTFCTAIGRPAKGTFLSLTRQIVFWLPLLLIMPLVFIHFGGPAEGIVGMMYSTPIADALAAIVSIFMIRGVFKKDLKTQTA